MHHICRTQLLFPSKDKLQVALENYRALSDPWLREKKITDIFANGLADRERSPMGLRMNIRLLLSAHTDVIPPQHQRDLLTLFTKVLTDIATVSTS